MADISNGVDIDTGWTEITAPLGLTTGSSYLIDIVEADADAVAWTAETDSAVAPTAAVNGNPIYPGSRKRGADPRIFTKGSGVFAWVRVDRGTARVSSVKV